MHFCEVRKLCTAEDLRGVENKLRALYHTTDGAACQALMTMEYQLWRMRVLQLLSSTAKTEEESASVLAYLCGYKLVYTQHMCVISQILPDSQILPTSQILPDSRILRDSRLNQHSTAVIQHSTRDTLKDQRQFDSEGIFKKQRTCLFQRQV